MKKRKMYALYNRDDELAFVGTCKECVEFLGHSVNTFRSMASRHNRGIVKKGHKYSIYTLEEEKEENE